LLRLFRLFPVDANGARRSDRIAAPYFLLCGLIMKRALIALDRANGSLVRQKEQSALPQ